MSRQLIIPTYVINGGFDVKFQSEPREVHNLDIFSDKITPQDYRQSIENVNKALKSSRAGKMSLTCLLMGPLMFPLVPYAFITYRNKRIRKKCLLEAIQKFNTNHPSLHMRWRRKPASQLVIEDAEIHFFKHLGEMDVKDRIEKLFLNT